MKKKIKIVSLLMMALIFFVSCEDFLEEDVVSGVGFGYYDDQKGIEDGVNALYLVFRTIFTYNNECMLRLTEAGTDAFTQTTEGNKNFHRYDAGLNPDNGTVNTLWNESYRTINLANQIISSISEIEFDDEEIKRSRLGEAHFVRGFLYFTLVRQFGRVPMKLTPTNSVELEFTREAVDVIYEQVLADLQIAKDYLPHKSETDYGRANLGAAQHLLSLVYLTRASAETDIRGSESYDLDSAIYYAEALINSPGYDLEPDYNDVFNYYIENKKDNESSPETIFAIQHSNDLNYDPNGNWYQLFYVAEYDVQPGMERDILNGRPYRRHKPTDFFYDAFERNVDSRLYKSVKMTWICNNPTKNIPMVDGEPKYHFSIGDTAIVMTFQENVEQDYLDNFTDYHLLPKSVVDGGTMVRSGFDIGFYPHIKKFMDPHRLTPNQQGGFRDLILYRLAETYLIAAEAYGRKGDYPTAVTLINAVRTRAAYKEGEVKPHHFFLFDGGDMANLTASTEAEMLIDASDINSPDLLVDFILDERMRELSGEFHRWYDLVRCGKLEERVSAHNDVAAANVQEYHKLRPIPQDHINSISNAGTLSREQNEGYY